MVDLPAPKPPLTAEQVIIAMLKTNANELTAADQRKRDASVALGDAEAEVARLNHIRRGLQAAAEAIRSVGSSPSRTTEKPPLIPSPPPPPAMGQRG